MRWGEPREKCAWEGCHWRRRHRVPPPRSSRHQIHGVLWMRSQSLLGLPVDSSLPSARANRRFALFDASTGRWMYPHCTVYISRNTPRLTSRVSSFMDRRCHRETPQLWKWTSGSEDRIEWWVRRALSPLVPNSWWETSSRNPFRIFATGTGAPARLKSVSLVSRRPPPSLARTRVFRQFGVLPQRSARHSWSRVGTSVTKRGWRSRGGILGASSKVSNIPANRSNYG